VAHDIQPCGGLRVFEQDGALGVDIEGQALTTRDQLGYLLTDIGTDYAPDVVQALNRMPETVRLRVLS